MPVTKFSCSRCGKRFMTSEVPVPGRSYRVPCRCGSTIVLQFGQSPETVPPLPASPRHPHRPPAPASAHRPPCPPPLPTGTFALAARKASPPHEPAHPASVPPPAVQARSPDEPSTFADDPFARAASLESTAPEATAPRLARRDPDAPSEDSVGIPVEPAPGEIFRRSIAATLAAGRDAGARACALVARAASPAWIRKPSVRGAATGAVLGTVLMALVARISPPAEHGSCAQAVAAPLADLAHGSPLPAAHVAPSTTFPTTAAETRASASERAAARARRSAIARPAPRKRSVVTGDVGDSRSAAEQTLTVSEPPPEGAAAAREPAVVDENAPAAVTLERAGTSSGDEPSAAPGDVSGPFAGATAGSASAESEPVHVRSTVEGDP